jgi:citrate lyase beta subunit
MAAVISTMSIALPAVATRLLLFAPGNEARELDRPLLPGADALSFLEDPEAESAKDETRGTAAAALGATLGAQVQVFGRVGGVGTHWSGHELAAPARPAVTRVIVPNINSDAPVRVDFERSRASRRLIPRVLARCATAATERRIGA